MQQLEVLLREQNEVESARRVSTRSSTLPDVGVGGQGEPPKPQEARPAQAARLARKQSLSVPERLSESELTQFSRLSSLTHN